MHRKNTFLLSCYCKRNYTLCSALPSSGRVVSLCSTIFCDVTPLWLLPSSSTPMFQYLMVFCCWGSPMGPICLWDSCWPSVKSIITAPAATFVSFNASDSCNNILNFFYLLGGWGQVVSPTPNLQEDQGVTLCLVSTLQPFWHWWPYQEYMTPADIALRFIETCKLAYQVNVLTSL